MSKEIKEIIKRICAVCGREISVHIYKKLNHKSCNYRGGHYFGKIPFYKKKDLEKSAKNTKKVKIEGLTLNVFRKDPKAYKYEEYWECPKCYWQYEK